MHKLEKEYIEYCKLNELDILSPRSSNKFFDTQCDLRNEEMAKLVDDYELNFDVRPILATLFVPTLCKILKRPWPIFSLFNLSLNDNLTITERQEEIDLLTLPFLSRHTIGHLKRNDFLAAGLYITECLKCDFYNNAKHYALPIFENKFKNKCITNFFESYIKIFAGEVTDPEEEFDSFKFGTFGFLTYVLYFLYYLREEDNVKAKDVLMDLEHESKETYYLFALGFCSTKIDITSTPSIESIKNFGLIDPSKDIRAYDQSVLDLVLFLKLTCSYCFKYFYNFQSLLGEIATENLTYYMDNLTTQDKLVAVAVMIVGLQVIENMGKSCLVRIEEVRNAISFASQEAEENNDEDDLKYFVKFMSQDEEEFRKALIHLEEQSMISCLDFESGTFFVEDELFIFTNTFSVSLLSAIKNNPELLTSSDLDDLSITSYNPDDFKDHES